jgi:hypothetical protein
VAVDFSGGEFFSLSSTTNAHLSGFDGNELAIANPVLYATGIRFDGDDLFALSFGATAQLSGFAGDEFVIANPLLYQNGVRFSGDELFNFASADHVSLILHGGSGNTIDSGSVLVGYAAWGAMS